MEWISANWKDLVVIAASVMIAARLIVKLTPTPKDDTVLEKVVAVLKALGLHIEDKG
jgi:DUF1009 family protein